MSLQCPCQWRRRSDAGTAAASGDAGTAAASGDAGTAAASGCGLPVPRALRRLLLNDVNVTENQQVQQVSPSNCIVEEIFTSGTTEVEFVRRFFAPSSTQYYE